MPFIEVEKGVRIFVADLNPDAKQTILFIHGWPANHQMFEYQFDQLPKHGFRCLGMDIKGFGKSDRPWEGYSYSSLADDVRCVIEALKLKDITLLGMSVGGAISVKYMARHAGFGVSKLALVGSATPLFTQRPDYPYGLPLTEVDQLILQTYTDRPKMVSDFGVKFFASNPSPQFMKWFTGLCLEASGNATIKVALSLRDEDLRNESQQISVPTTIFHGLRDQIVPFPNAEVMQQYVRGSRLIPFEFSGHGLFYDELDKFNYSLLQFLNQ